MLSEIAIQIHNWEYLTHYIFFIALFWAIYTVYVLEQK